MDFSQPQTYVIPAVLAVFFAWRFIKFRRVRAKVPDLLAQGALVVDVRSRGEYAGGAREGSINIPLDELEKGAERIDRDTPLILCCASGARSAMALALLKRKGFRSVVNAGAWQNTIV